MLIYNASCSSGFDVRLVYSTKLQSRNSLLAEVVSKIPSLDIANLNVCEGHRVTPMYNGTSFSSSTFWCVIKIVE